MANKINTPDRCAPSDFFVAAALRATATAELSYSLTNRLRME
jgi:hypothetical protein